MINALISELETVESLLNELKDMKIMQWIDVNDRLPEDTEPTDYYLITRPGEQGVSESYVGILKYSQQVWKRLTDCGEITHWMPLPEPARSA